MTIHEYILKFVDPKFVGNLPFEVSTKTFSKKELISKYGSIENHI
jgi:hypothetical protein